MISAGHKLRPSLLISYDRYKVEREKEKTRMENLKNVSGL